MMETAFSDQFQIHPVGRYKEYFSLIRHLYWEVWLTKIIANISLLRALSMLTDNSLTTEGDKNVCT